jgi:NhaA family Na+:H+ antiporter
MVFPAGIYTLFNVLASDGHPAGWAASTAKAKAMSVAIGMAQPAGCPSLANTLNSV